MSQRVSEIINGTIKDNSAFISCEKCSQFQINIECWISHLVEFHPIPTIWMSASTDLMDRRLMAPYTMVTDSRKTRKKNNTPRPLNSFMIFSRHLRRVVLLIFASQSNSEISKLLGKFWTELSPNIKNMYNLEAKRLAILHSEEFPDYKYMPQRRKKHNQIKLNSQVLHDHKSIKSDSSSSSKFPLYINNYNDIKHNQNDTDSVSSSCILQNKIEKCQSISPMSNQSFEYFSGKNYIANKIEHGDNYTQTFEINEEMCLHYYENNTKNKKELPVLFTKPLIIVTEKMNGKPILTYKKNAENVQIEQTILNHNLFIKNVEYLKNRINYETFNNMQVKSNKNVAMKVDSEKVCEPETNCLTTKDPLMNDDLFEKNSVNQDCYDLCNENNNYCSSWFLPSPNCKLSAISSNSSSNNDHDINNSSSQFLLSESNNNILQIQRLPGIGSWLRSNYSENMI